MKDAKLVDLLKCFSSSEMKRFRDFVCSPYFNKKDNLNKFIDILFNHHPGFDKASFTKEKVFGKIFQNEKYTEHKMNDMMSELVKLSKDFFAFNNLETDDTRKRQLMIEEWQKKSFTNYKEEMQKLIKGELESMRKITETEKRGEKHYYNLYLLESYTDNYQLSQNQHTSEQGLQWKADNLDIYYTVAQLKNTCEMINRRNIVKTDFKIKLIQGVIGYIASKPEYMVIPAIAIYYRIYLTLVDGEIEGHFLELHRLLAKHDYEFEPDEAGAMYSYAKNYCVKQINKGNPAYLDHYQKLIDQVLKLDKDYISEWEYKNMVTVGCRLKRFDWTKQFMDAYKQKLNPSIRENAYSYNLANYLFSQGQFEKAQQLLVKVEFTDIFYNLDSRSRLLQIYYEVDEFDAFNSIVKSFSEYLRRNSAISDYQKEVYQNFIRLTNKIYSVKLKVKSFDKKSGAEAVVNLRQSLMDTTALANQSWLTEKVQSLENEFYRVA